MNSRSKSVDRPILQRSKRIFPNLRSYTSVDECSSCSNITTTLQPDCLIAENKGVQSRPKSLLISEIPALRRCSVPAVSLQQLGHLSRRRESIGTFVEEDLTSGLEIKKRHRMIQRH